MIVCVLDGAERGPTLRDRYLLDYKKVMLGVRGVRREFVWAMAILAAGFTAFLIYAWPGYMSIDSAQQLLEGRSHQYTDWHPPAMAWLWHVVDWFVKGPLGMLLLQAGAFLVGLYRLLRRAYAPRTAAVIAIAVFLFPPVVAPMAVIWKDSQMAGYLLLGFSLILDARRGLQVTGLGLILVATAMRYNAPAATLPLVALGFVWRANHRWFVTMAIALACWLAITVAASAGNKLLTVKHSYTWHTALAPADIAGVLRYGHYYTDAELLVILDGTPLVPHDHIGLTAHRVYNPTSWWAVINGEGRLFNWPENAAHRAALEQAWKTLVFANPVAYLHHRWSVFRATLGVGEYPLFAPFWNGKPSADYLKALDYDRDPDATQIEIGRAINWAATRTFMFRPYLYFYLALLLLPLAWRHRDLLALLSSGILYELTLFPFGTPDVRYSHWLTVTTVIVITILFRRRYLDSRSGSVAEHA